MNRKLNLVNFLVQQMIKDISCLIVLMLDCRLILIKRFSICVCLLACACSHFTQLIRFSPNLVDNAESFHHLPPNQTLRYLGEKCNFMKKNICYRHYMRWIILTLKYFSWGLSWVLLNFLTCQAFAKCPYITNLVTSSYFTFSVAIF